MKQPRPLRPPKVSYTENSSSLETYKFLQSDYIFRGWKYSFLKNMHWNGGIMSLPENTQKSQVSLYTFFSTSCLIISYNTNESWLISLLWHSEDVTFIWSLWPIITFLQAFTQLNKDVLLHNYSSANFSEFNTHSPLLQSIYETVPSCPSIHSCSILQPTPPSIP